MSDENKVVVDGAADESELDAALEASIASVKAGQTLEETPSSQTGETGSGGTAGDVTPTGETGSTGEAPTGETSATGASGEVDGEFRIPNKGKFESDEAYEKRVELFDLVTRRKAATTPEAKAALTADIKRAKQELGTASVAERFIQSKDLASTGATGEVDPVLAADQERLRALGGATKQDVEAIVAQTHHDAAVRSDLKTFIGKHESLNDEDVREVFFDFVDGNYVWEGKSGKELIATLEMAYENMFRPAETVQARVLKAAGVAEKINAMQFPGGTAGGSNSYSPEMRKSIDELKATGMSEDKAAELLKDL